MQSSKNGSALVAFVVGPLVMWAMAGLAAMASGQQLAPPVESTPVESTAVEFAPPQAIFANVEVDGGPQDLPGRERGDRAPDAEKPPAATSETPEGEREWFGHKPIWEWSRLTGDWGGGRTYLEDNGVTISGSYTFDWTSVWDGGAKNVASTRSLLDINALVNFEKLFEWNGGTFYADFYSSDMRGGTPDVGSIQGIDNAETGKNLDQFAEVWFEQKLFDNVLRIKAGKIDALNEFAFVGASSDNVHATAGALNTIVGFPTYPDPSTGVVAFVYPTPQLYVGGGLFDGATVDGFATGRRGPATFFSDSKSSSWFTIGEVGLTWKSVLSLGPGRAFVGGWYHSATFDAFDGARHDGTGGVFAMAEQQFWARGEGDDAARGLFGWVQYGHADDEISAISDQYGGGVKLVGTFSARDSDTAGVFFTFAELSDKGGFAEDELALELFYTVQVTPAVKVKPDLQFIFNPAGDRAIDDAIVGGLRVEIAF